MSRALQTLVLVTFVSFGTNAAENPAPSSPMMPAPGVLPPTGYLAPNELPSSVKLVPIPPTAGTSAMARDEEVSRSALALHGGPRWELATRDASLSFPVLADSFACALGTTIDQERAPKLMTLLRRTLGDAARSTSEAKHLYKRARPFTINEKPLCTPDLAEALRRDGSYPSGHAVIGWVFALILSELAPDQANAILARGRAFGQSRIVCNAHWQSDVLEGQMVASAVVARLHADEEFRADLEVARAEVAKLRAQPIAAGRDCEVESQTLAAWK